MSDTRPLLPPAHVVHEQLALNQRERRRLRTILRLIIEADQDSKRMPPEQCTRPSLEGSGVAS
jgi:hypothetical protein